MPDAGRTPGVRRCAGWVAAARAGCRSRSSGLRPERSATLTTRPARAPAQGDRCRRRRCHLRQRLGLPHPAHGQRRPCGNPTVWVPFNNAPDLKIAIETKAAEYTFIEEDQQRGKPKPAGLQAGHGAQARLRESSVRARRCELLTMATEPKPRLRKLVPSLGVSDLRRSVAFYRDFFGFSMVDSWEDESGETVWCWLRSRRDRVDASAAVARPADHAWSPPWGKAGFSTCGRRIWTIPGTSWSMPASRCPRYRSPAMEPGSVS